MSPYLRLTMAKSATIQGVDIERISFIDTLRWLITAVPGERLSERLINPLRPERSEPRALKRRVKQYALMNRPRWELRQRLIAEDVAA